MKYDVEPMEQMKEGFCPAVGQDGLAKSSEKTTRHKCFGNTCV